jgi:hypothetical protein
MGAICLTSATSSFSGDALQYALSLEHPQCLAERAAAYAEFLCQVRLPQLLLRDERPSQDEITDRPRARLTAPPSARSEVLTRSI